MLATTGKVTSQKIVAPEIAIIIPVFKHSVLVAEAITCALQQNTEIPFVIIIVNDGCTFKETDRVGRDFALAYPDQVIYLYRPNGGLSAARNTGIEFALAAWNSVKAIYLLDADNRISAHTIDRSFKALQANSEVGWIYPTIDMFGREEGGDFDYRGEYSVLRHLRFNTCEAGSMIRREVFERGCRYDESMKLGFEDWEFWWQAIKVGYRGKHLPESGFQYRKRFESMLSNSERDGQGIKDYIRRKHRSLLTHRHILGLEHREAPRYAIFLSDTNEIILTSDPTFSDCSISIDKFGDYYHRARLMSVRYHRPYFLVFTNSSVLKTLQQKALIHGLFWHLERVQQTTNFACLSIDNNSTEQAITIRRVEGASELNVGENDHLTMTTVKVIDECLLDQQEVWIHSLISPHPMPNIVQLQLQIPQPELPEIPQGECLYKLLSIFKTLRRALRQRDQKSWNWHNNYLPSRCLMFQDARLALDCHPVYPKLVETEQKQVGFILSILEFGGVEKVALNLAKVFHDQGWKVHLFIFGSRMQQLPEWAKVFTTINFYHEPTMTPWQGHKYLGTKSDPWSQREEHLIAKGLLCWLDVAINFHNATVNNIMGQLRRSGVKTVMSLHVHDLSPWNRPAGHTYLTLGYEHAYDLIMPCSHNMADWCHAMGIPEEKIVVVPNAAGYPLESTKVTEIIARKRSRRNRSSCEQLKVLFLGRFDRQKGLDRLVEVVTQSRQMQLPIDWKLVGKNILEGDNTADELISIQDLIEPPALTTEGLNQLYEWADVLFLPSYWEGLPLTILEAMRLGVVVCASDVGAINEAIEHQVTGLIITDTQKEKFVTSAIAFLQELATNSVKLESISEAATIKISKLSWQEASTDLRKKLEALMNKEHSREAS